MLQCRISIVNNDKYMDTPYLSDAEVRQLLDSIFIVEHKTAIQMGIDLGCRVGEIITIPNLPEFTFNIQILDSKSENEVKKKSKTSRTPYRQCLITRSTLNQIRTFQVTLKNKKDNRKLLFPYDEKTLNRWLKHWCEVAGIKRDNKRLIRWHMLRHTYVQNAINKKVDLKKVSLQTGDSIYTLINYYNNYTLDQRQLTAEETSLV